VRVLTQTTVSEEQRARVCCSDANSPLIGSEREARGCMLMTLHKSKGKEFDGVVIVEGFSGGALLRPDEAPHYEPSRRVLRVGITRARQLVVLVRPQRAQPLVG
jgi:DNA helicase-2/ATP-dependent DNA helicase PcrA